MLPMELMRCGHPRADSCGLKPRTGMMCSIRNDLAERDLQKTHWWKDESVMEDADVEKPECGKPCGPLKACGTAFDFDVKFVQYGLAGYRCNANPVALNVVVRSALHL
eukprot:3158973-Amphidinium_carterae.1